VGAALGAAGVELVDVPRPALFLAGKAFQTYRARADTRTGVLSDFFIGARAVVESIALLTRDVRRYRSYFPSITLIAPGDA
jgi:predicted nucleic acid-binding protein